MEASYYPLNGEVDLFRLHIPEQPEQLVLQLKGQGQRGGLYTVELGAWSALLHAKAWGKAGAMLAASGEAAINFANGGFRLSGMTWVDKVRIKKGPIEGEIGVEVGSSVTGEVQWMPPRRLMQRLQWQQDRWPTSLCKLTAGVKADLKLKMTGSPIMLSWQGNKPKLCVKAGVFSGVASAEGYIELEINPAGLNYVVTLFQDMLRQCHYERVTIYADDATYQRMSMLSQLAL
ncbi:hypothetical protein, partial [Aeromonas cavernicola]|uniref:hypothetical protein n=1 Tax=Aeromonas cavernicola TaxID=1006623 RepID=UPI0012FDCA8A